MLWLLQAAFILRCKAMVAKVAPDDTELEEVGLAEQLLDDHAISKIPRPGTSFASASGNRPLTSSARPNTGFARPGTSTYTRYVVLCDVISSSQATNGRR